MNPKSLLGLFFTSIALYLSSSAVSGQAPIPETKPNFLWVLIEDTSPSAYSCYGLQKAAATPVIDALAAAGVRYNRFYTTAPVCSPSRSAFMTGMYAVSIGAHHHRTESKKPLPEGVRFLPDIFREAGYFTANVVHMPKGAGFKGTGKTDWNFAVSKAPFDSKNWKDLESHQPFFAQINLYETHRYFQSPEKTAPAAIELPPYYPDDALTRKDYAEYLDAAKGADANIAAILAQLKADGLDKNTIVIVMGDNGEAHVRGKQFCYEEGLNVPLVVYIPKGLPRPAHYAPGKVDNRLLEAIDIAPTLLSFAGIPIPPKMQGRPFLGEQSGPDKEYVFGARDRCDETAMRIRSVRDARYRYIHNFTPEVPFLAPNEYKANEYPVWNHLKELDRKGKLTPTQAVLCAPRQQEEELYDLENDPHEINNLATSTNPEHQAELKRLRAVLDAWIVAVDDQGRFPEAKAEAVEPAQKKQKKKKQ